MRSAALFLVTIVLLAAGAATVVAAPRYEPVSVRPSASPLFVIEQPPPTPSPSPTPTATPAPTAPPAATNPPGLVTFPMPVYKQVMNLDCETAALQMGLAAMGHTYTQQALFAGQNPDLRKPVLVPGTKKVVQWGDPYTNFVGDVNGSDLGPTGYGVYYPLILAIARSHGAPSSTGGETLTAAQVYAAVASGHPVLVWVETGWENARAAGYTGVWTAWDGRSIKYSLIEHVVTLSGVSATQVRVNDPWKSGSQYWYGKAAFEASWADFNNMAVILQ